MKKRKERASASDIRKAEHDVMDILRLHAAGPQRRTCASIIRGLVGISITLLVNFRLQREDPRGADLRKMKMVRLSRISRRDGRATVSGVIDWEDTRGRESRAWTERFLGRFRETPTGAAAYDCLVGHASRSRVLIRR